MPAMDATRQRSAMVVKPLSPNQGLEAVWQLMRDAYTVEARLIGCDDFPPLSRSVADLKAFTGRFYVTYDQDNPVGVLQLSHAKDCASIDSLCVAPSHFRRGIGRALLEHILALGYPTVRVSTAALNAPATSLYLKLGFTQVGESEKSSIHLHHFEWSSPRHEYQAMNMTDIPNEFEPIFRSSPYLDLLGPLYNNRTDACLVIGFRAAEKHCNARELVHGGVLSSLADIALGYNAAFLNDKPVPMVTASLTIDYAGAAKLGDWIEIHTDVQKVGRSVAFANCYFFVGEKRIARASGVFNVVRG